MIISSQLWTSGHTSVFFNLVLAILCDGANLVTGGAGVFLLQCVLSRHQLKEEIIIIIIFSFSVSCLVIS